MDTCVCGHQIEAHGHDKKYPGSTACTEKWDRDPCPCIMYEEDQNAADEEEERTRS